MDLDLANGVTPTRCVISLGSVSGADTVTKGNQTQNLFLRLDELLLQPLDDNFLIFVFKKLELLVVVEQVVDLSSVNFVHGNRHSEVALVLLKVVDTSFKQVLNRQLLQTLHCECFP